VEYGVGIWLGLFRMPAQHSLSEICVLHSHCSRIFAGKESPFKKQSHHVPAKMREWIQPPKQVTSCSHKNAGMESTFKKQSRNVPAKIHLHKTSHVTFPQKMQERNQPPERVTKRPAFFAGT
jgi:hypothetical protein